MKKSTILFIFMGIIWLSCENDQKIDEIAYMESLLDNEVLLNLDLLDTEGAMDEEYTDGIDFGSGYKIMADTLYPNDSYRLRFGRHVSDRSRDYSFDVQGDTAFANIVHSISGNFFVVALDSNHALVDSFVKPFTESFERSVRFVATDSASDRPWRIDGFTIGRGGSGTKTRITNVTYYTADTDSQIVAFSYSGADLNDYYFQRDDLPTFSIGEHVKVEVTVENDDPVFDPSDWDSGEKVIAHFGRGRGERARRGFNDAGVFADNVADDNIYSVWWRAHHIPDDQQSRAFNIHFSCIDNATLYIDDGGFNTAVWSLPYRIVRP